MHRVELKVFKNKLCSIKLPKFLMHRVELKERFACVPFSLSFLFLMHRVELKGYHATNCKFVQGRS